MKDSNGILSFRLGMEHYNRCKYGAAIIAVQILNDLKLDVDWKYAIKIFTDVDEFLNYKTEVEYIKAVLIKYLEVVPDFNIDPNIFDSLSESSKKSCKYIINERELLTLKKIWKKFIKNFVEEYRKGNTSPVIEIPVIHISKMYNSDNLVQNYAHFSQTVKYFLNYHMINYQQLHFIFSSNDMLKIKLIT